MKVGLGIGGAAVITAVSVKLAKARAFKRMTPEELEAKLAEEARELAASEVGAKEFMRSACEELAVGAERRKAKLEKRHAKLRAKHAKRHPAADDEMPEATPA